MATHSSSTHSGCLLCGDRNPRSLGLHFESDGNGGVRAGFRAQPYYQGYDGMLHGGVIAALLDAGMTHCLFHRRIQAVTGDLYVRFVHPVRCGENLEIRAWLLSSDPPLFLLKSEVRTAGRVLAWAEAKFMARKSVRFR